MLLADVETKEVAADGSAKFRVTVSGVDARDIAGAKTPGADFKKDLASLTGATIEGTVGAERLNDADLKMRVEKPDEHTLGAIGSHQAVADADLAGAADRADRARREVDGHDEQKVADQLEVTQTTDFQLVSTKGKDWTIKGTTKVTGTEQDIEGAKFGGIAGEGSTEATLNQGSLLPAAKQQVKTDFTATAEPQPNQKVSLNFHLEQGNTVTPKQ